MRYVRHRLRAAFNTVTLAALALPATAALAQTSIPLNAREDLDTFYVNVDIAGVAPEDYLVDTGAGYMTITDETLARSKDAGTATYLRQLEGRMADGSVLEVPVYRLSEITIGGSCRLRNVEVAVLPGASRGLFGLSALRKMSPFQFSVDPPSLQLSNCGATLADAGAE
ncbi:MAG: retropepsin-like aspartic protease family protein [Pseudomonadota bacterium]